MSENGETLNNKQGDAQPVATSVEQQPSPDASASGDAATPDGVAGLVAEVISDQIEDADESALRGDIDELGAVAAQRDEYLALAQRTQADFENYRKRVARESAAALERGTSSLAKELLPALDNLDRALDEARAAGADSEGEDPLLAGVRLVRAELSAALARARIESYSPVGEPFDPELHEAMATAEQPPDGHPSGTVVEVYQPGYRIGTSIIRPARVVVAA